MLRQERLLRNHIDGTQGLLQCRYRLKVSDNSNFLPVGDSSLNSSRAVAEVVEATLLRIVGNFVVRLGTSVVGNAHTLSDFNSLDGVDAHDGLSQSTVQPCVPAGMRPQSQRNASRHDFESPAD